MVSINKSDYLTWKPEVIGVQDITVMDLCVLLYNAVYFVVKTEGMYIEKEISELNCDADLSVLQEFEQKVGQRVQKNGGKMCERDTKNEGILCKCLSEELSDNELNLVKFEFVPLNNFCVNYAEGRLVIKYIQYDYIRIKDIESLKKAVRSGLIQESGLKGIRCNKQYKELVLWTYKEGWLVDTIELVKHNEDGEYKRIIVNIRGALKASAYTLDDLYYAYLRASWTTERERLFPEKYDYDKDYKRLKWNNRGLLKNYGAYYDKYTSMALYTGGVMQHSLKTNEEVYTLLCKRENNTLKRNSIEQIKYVEAHLQIEKGTKLERIRHFEFAMLNCMLTDGFRSVELAYFEETKHWFHKYDVGYGLNLVIRRDWLEKYI